MVKIRKLIYQNLTSSSKSSFIDRPPPLRKILSTLLHLHMMHENGILDRDILFKDFKTQIFINELTISQSFRN